MRILYVVQRYGERVAGGAEQHARELAQRLVSRGHTVEVLTTCATSYVDWANVLEPGQSIEHGVVVHREPVLRPRNATAFGEFNGRMMHSRSVRPLTLQRDWLEMEGPQAPGIPRFLRHRASDYDVVVFITYLYWTAWAGLHAIAGSVPTILHPTAHDEPPLRYSIFNDVFRLPDALAFLTPEEAELVRSRFPGSPPGEVVGVGVDLDGVADPTEFRARWRIGDAPYLIYVGRVDPAKGASELLDGFLAYKDLHGGDVKLVFLGEALIDLPNREDIVVTGFVSSGERDAALAGALALAHPSYFESFSMALAEAFAQSRPALVQERSAVMAGHAARSGGAIPYSGFGEFEAAVTLLLERPELADELGRRGRAYVEREYAWPVVLDRYERLLASTVARLGGRVSAS
jgi:glycosyltransferase involved in cell wall biosynthesis